MTTPNNSKFYDAAQNFYVDSQVVQGAAQIRIASVDLFFKSKPSIDSNHTGILAPTVSIFIVPTIYGVPSIEVGRDYDIARLQYNDIISSSDASIPSRFRFDIPILVDTDKKYSVIIKFDGGSSFVLWKSKQGDYITGTNTISPGPTGKYTGEYYENISLTYNPNTQQPDQTQYQGNWSPLSDTDLKFNINASRYFLNGTDVSANTVAPGVQIIGVHPSGSATIADGNTFIIPSTLYEFFMFNQDTSIKGSLVGAQIAYQNTFSYPGGISGNGTYLSISTTAGSDIVTANNTLPNGQAFAWSSIYSVSSITPAIVMYSGNVVNVRYVKNILSNTQIQLTEPVAFTNTNSQFSVTPVGRIDYFNKGNPFGLYTSMLNLQGSTANSTVRFVNNVVEFASIVAGGNSYTNSDVLWVKGFENIPGVVEGGYQASANIRTNSSGTITGLYWANNGCGFVNASAIYTVITSNNNPSANANTSVGSGANIALTIGSTLYSELTGNKFSNATCINIPLSEVIPYFEIENPTGSSFNLQLKTQYYRTPANTFSGYSYFIDTTANSTPFDLTLFQKNQLISNNVPTFVSRSNEFITKYPNGSNNDLILSTDTFSRNLRLIINHESNNDFVALSINNWPTAHLSKYVINNDYTGENTDQGSAWAKGISNKFSFTRPAEDLVVRLTAYKPSNTDIKVYARIWNNSDPEAFDDKDWTLLEQTDGIGLVSSSIKLDDYIDVEYSIPQYQNVALTIPGTVTTTSNSNVLTGTGTSFTNSLSTGSVVRLYNPLFPNNHVVSSVISITNNTSLALDYSIANNGLIGSGFFLDITDYPLQTFNNIQNANVARYYNTSKMKFDGFDTVQIKFVLLSDSPNKVPKIDDFRAIGVSS